MISECFYSSSSREGKQSGGEEEWRAVMRGNPTASHSSSEKKNYYYEKNKIKWTLLPATARIQIQLGMVCENMGGAFFNIKHRKHTASSL